MTSRRQKKNDVDQTACVAASAQTDQALNKAEDEKLSEGLAAFLEGKSAANVAPTPFDENGVVFGALAAPLVEGLLSDKARSKTADRMLAELAGHCYADWAMYTRTLRVLKLRQAGGAPKEGDQLRKLASQSFKQCLAALELLKRTDPSSVRVSIGSASNVNLGSQRVETDSLPQPKQRGCKKKRQ